MSFNNLKYAAVGLILALGSCSGEGMAAADGPSASLTGEGFSYTVTVSGGKQTGESRYMGASSAGTKYWGATLEIHTGQNAGTSSIAPPSLFVGVPVGQTAVIPPTRGGMLNLPVAGSCSLDGAPGLLSGKGNNGVGDRGTAGVPDGFCLFSMLFDSPSGDRAHIGGGESITLAYVSNHGFTGGGLHNAVYFAADSDALGQPRGAWTELKS